MLKPKKEDLELVQNRKTDLKNDQNRKTEKAKSLVKLKTLKLNSPRCPQNTMAT